MTSSSRAVDLKAAVVLKPKTLAVPAEVPPIVLPPPVEHADHVAHIRTARIGAEEVPDDHFVCTELKARGVETEDIGRSGRAPADRVVRRR